MRTSAQYLQRLKDMNRNVYLDGQLVERDDQAIMPGINVINETFNYAYVEEVSDIMVAESHLNGEDVNRFCHIHQSPDDLIKKQDMIRFLCQKTGGCIQRCMGVDALNALSVVTKEMDDSLGTDYNTRFLDYLSYFQKNDLVGNCAQTDVKGDRMKRPHEQSDPDLYLRVVDERSDGIVVRGAKAHNTIAPYADEIIAIPTRLMTEQDQQWAVAFAIPADTEGVKLISRPNYYRPRRELEAPLARYGAVESLTIFDDVFVPKERVFMCGEYSFAGQLASLFATYHRHSYTGCKPAITDILLGAATLVAEYNGIARAKHVRDILAEMLVVGELVYGTGMAAAMKSTQAASGTYIPNEIFSDVARYHAGINIYREHEILAELAGGLPATLPLEGDFSHSETGLLLDKYIMRKSSISAENQHRCFRAISDLLCSSNAGVKQVAGVHGGGSPIMEKISIMGQYDLEAKKDIFKELAGIEE